MTSDTLRKLASRIESLMALDDTVAQEAVKALAPQTDDAGAPALDTADLDSTDALLGVMERDLPGWSVAMDGMALSPNGHWRCTLRRSAVRDNDEYIGVGRGPTLPHALLAAILKVLSFRT